MRSWDIPEYWRLDPTDGELYGQPITGERLIDGVYEPYEVHTESDGSVTSYSEALDLIFSWNEDGGFDPLDHETNRTIDQIVTERAARLVAEARADTAEALSDAERNARLDAESRADTAEARAVEEQQARQAAEVRAVEERQARLAAEARVRSKTSLSGCAVSNRDNRRLGSALDTAP